MSLALCSLWESLAINGIDAAHIKAARNLYENSVCYVKVGNKLSEEFRVRIKERVLYCMYCM
jgi:hypothetical protein